MDIKEDRDDFNHSGWRRLLTEMMKSQDQGFIKLTDGGKRGVVVDQQPELGTGPYLHFMRGEPVMKHENESKDDKRSKEVRHQP